MRCHAQARRTGNSLFMDEGKIVEALLPEKFFSAPEHERPRLFLSRIPGH